MRARLSWNDVFLAVLLGLWSLPYETLLLFSVSGGSGGQDEELVGR